MFTYQHRFIPLLMRRVKISWLLQDAYRSNAKDSLKVCHKVPEFHYLCGELQEFEDTVLKGVLSSPVIILCETDL